MAGIRSDNMGNELHRLATFKGFFTPDGVWPVQLARAGFYHSANCDKNSVVCFACGLCVDVDAMNNEPVTKLHSRLSPCCAVVLDWSQHGQLPEPTPSPPGRLSESTLCPPDNFTGQLSQFRMLSGPPVPGASILRRYDEMGPTARSSDTQSRPTGGSLGDTGDRGLSTYHGGSLGAADTGDMDRELQTDSDRDGMEPEHYAPPSVTLAQFLGRSLPGDNSWSPQQSHGQSAHGQTSDGQSAHGQTSDGQSAHGQTSDGQSAHGQALGGQLAPGQTSDGQSGTDDRTVTEDSTRSDSGTFSELGIVVQLTKHPPWVLTSDRLRSFRDWRGPRISQSWHSLAQAGFFYTGERDCCRCFYCGVTLTRWEPQDDPWVEHARWSPSCPYLSIFLGQRCLRDTPPPSRSREVMETMAETIGESARNGEQAVDQALPGESLSDGEHALESPQPGESVSCGEPAMDSRAQPGESVNDGEQAMDSRGQPGESVNDGEQAMDSDQEDQDDMETVTDSDLEERCEALQRENEQLRQESCCKVCLDGEASVLFLPCSHLAVCGQCAPALIACPMCRQTREGLVIVNRDGPDDE